MTARVVVVSSRFGGILSEIAGWLAASIDGALCSSDSPEVGEGRAALLVGSGPEFNGVLRRVSKARVRPTVILWAFDPFPPPGTDAAVTESGLRAGRWTHRLRRLDRAFGQPFGGAGAGGSAKRFLRSVAMSGLGGRAALTGVNEFSDAVMASAAYERLFWLTRAFRRGLIDRVFVSSPQSVLTLAEHGVPAEYQPIVRHPAMGLDHGGPRDLPAVFLGASGDRRGGRLATLVEQVERRGVPLTVVDRACYGEARTALLNRARVVVNLHKFPWHFERIRLLLSISNGALFVSEEPTPDTSPFVPGRHLLACRFDQLAETIAACAFDAAPRDAVVAAARTCLEEQPDLETVWLEHLREI